MYECFINKNFSKRSKSMIITANDIIREYEEQGYSLTLRQLYYQFVARDLIPNKDSEYKKLGSIINDARLAGEIDWSSLEDRTRNLRHNSHWNNPSELLATAVKQYAIDKWENQNYHIEVWVEKDALIGVIERTCKDLDINHFSCRGYVSASEMYKASKRLCDAQGKDKKPIILHLGDHDPSGKDMTYDIFKRLNLMAGYGFEAKEINEWYSKEQSMDMTDFDIESGIYVKRIALNMEQVIKFNPPPNPAKITDSRAKTYIQTHGYKSWELDALDPYTLDSLIRDHVLMYRDEILWEKAEEKEFDDIKKMKKLVKTLKEK